MIRQFVIGAVFGATFTASDFSHAYTTGFRVCPEGSRIVFVSRGDELVVLRPQDDLSLVMIRKGQRIHYDWVPPETPGVTTTYVIRGTGGKGDIALRDEWRDNDGRIRMTFAGIEFERRCQSPDGEIDVAYDTLPVRID